MFQAVRAAGVLVALTGLTAAAACRGAGSAPPPVVHRVVMDGTRFVPGDVSAAPGETILWTNDDPFPHTVAVEAAGAQSDSLATGQSWSFQPRQPGAYEYRCTLHPGMTGVIHVR